MDLTFINLNLCLNLEKKTYHSSGIVLESEAVVRRCSVKKVFFEISQNSQENTCARDSFLIKLPLVQVFFCEFCEISKNTFIYKTPPVVASVEYIS